MLGDILGSVAKFPLKLLGHEEIYLFTPGISLGLQMHAKVQAVVIQACTDILHPFTIEYNSLPHTRQLLSKIDGVRLKVW